MAQYRLEVLVCSFKIALATQGCPSNINTDIFTLLPQMITEPSRMLSFKEAGHDTSGPQARMSRVSLHFFLAR